MLSVSTSVSVCDLRIQRVGSLVDLPFASVLPTISLAETKVQGRWLKQSVTKACQLAQHNCDNNYVCMLYLAVMSTSSLRGRRDHDSCYALQNKIRLADCKLGFDACSDTRFLRLQIVHPEIPDQIVYKQK